MAKPKLSHSIYRNGKKVGIPAQKRSFVRPQDAPKLPRAAMKGVKGAANSLKKAASIATNTYLKGTDNIRSTTSKKNGVTVRATSGKRRGKY